MNHPVFQKIRDYGLLIGEGAVDLAISLVVMVMVERSLGVAGLGIFSYLISLLVFGGFFSDFGLSGYLEREIATHRGEAARNEIIENAARAVLATSAGCALVFFAFAVTGMTWTQVNERSAAYVIMGLTIIFRNFNRLRIAVLQGRGEYDGAATLKIHKRLYLLAAVVVFLKLGFPPSYLMLGYLVAEIGLMLKSRKAIRLPNIRALVAGRQRLSATLERSAGFFLTDEALDAIFYMDFFILGFFVTSRELGLYAEASILARIFLLIPISIKPVFLGRYCALAAGNRLKDAAASIKISAAGLFFLHGVMALYLLLFFSDIMQAVFEINHMSSVPFYIFAEILPGLLFFSAVISQEPIYEAAGGEAFLQRKIILVAGLNLCLNLFCIPFAGFFGAAFATSASMFAYFIGFGGKLDPALQIHKVKFIFAGASVYLTFMALRAFAGSPVLVLFAAPFMLWVLLKLTGFFDVDPENDLRLSDVMRLVWKHPQMGGSDDGRK